MSNVSCCKWGSGFENLNGLYVDFLSNGVTNHMCVYACVLCRLLKSGTKGPCL